MPRKQNQENRPSSGQFRCYDCDKSYGTEQGLNSHLPQCEIRLSKAKDVQIQAQSRRVEHPDWDELLPTHEQEELRRQSRTTVENLGVNTADQNIDVDDPPLVCS